MLPRIQSLLRVAGDPEPRLADGVVVAALAMILVQLGWMTLVGYANAHIDEPRGEIEVKGLHYPVRVYEVAGEASIRS